jgi:hypothetical protein
LRDGGYDQLVWLTFYLVKAPEFIATLKWYLAWVQKIVVQFMSKEVLAKRIFGLVNTRLERETERPDS